MAKRSYRDKLVEKRLAADDMLRRYHGVDFAALARDPILKNAGVTEQFLRNRAREIGMVPKAI